MLFTPQTCIQTYDLSRVYETKKYISTHAHVCKYIYMHINSYISLCIYMNHMYYACHLAAVLGVCTMSSLITGNISMA